MNELGVSATRYNESAAMKSTAQLMEGKKGLIMGVANDRSMAWGIAQALAAHGADIALTYQGDALKKRVVPLAEAIGSTLVLPCDVNDNASLDDVFDTLGRTWGRLDFVVHAIAYSDKDQLKGRYVDTTLDNFSQTLAVSCYSFTAVCRRAEALMTDGGSLLTLTYSGAERVMPHYNVMGVAKAALEASVRYLAEDLGKKQIRVNALSAGPMKTLAASGIGDFRFIMRWNQYNSPLRRNITPDDVGGAGLYLLSDLSSGVSGEVHHVDGGYHAIGMMVVDAMDNVKDLLDSFSIKS
jgi:enoyl-[acyl-carrier protein] reductase I